jgi:hypothetical protein
MNIAGEEWTEMDIEDLKSAVELPLDRRSRRVPGPRRQRRGPKMRGIGSEAEGLKRE